MYQNAPPRRIAPARPGNFVPAACRPLVDLSALRVDFLRGRTREFSQLGTPFCSFGTAFAIRSGTEQVRWGGEKADSLVRRVNG